LFPPLLPAAQPHHLCCPVQSLDAASAAAGMAAPSSASDAGYMRVLLFARKMQTIRAVFTPPDAAASTRHGGRHGVAELNAFLDAYCKEVYAPHLKSLLQRLIGGRAGMLAGDKEGIAIGSGAEPVDESARAVVATCAGALPQLGDYHSRVVKYVDASVAMARGFRRQHHVTSSLSEIHAEHADKSGRLLCTRWMHEDLLDLQAVWLSHQEDAEAVVFGAAPSTPDFAAALSTAVDQAAASPPATPTQQILSVRASPAEFSHTAVRLACMLSGAGIEATAAQATGASRAGDSWRRRRFAQPPRNGGGGFGCARRGRDRPILARAGARAVGGSGGGGRVGAPQDGSGRHAALH